MAISFYDILGIDRRDSSVRMERAAELWPADRVHFVLGADVLNTPVDDLMEYLQSTLKFRSVMPGAAGDSVGLYVEVEVVNPVVPPPLPLVIRTMPDVAFFLQDTEVDKPARCYFTKTAQGKEIVIEGLPVEIKLPAGLLTPLVPGGAVDPPLTPPFVAGILDSYHVVLRDLESSSIFVHLKVRMTREIDFIIEPAVVMSVGPCMFSGLPCFGVHDLSLLAAPTLTGDHQKIEQAVEWTRHTIELSELLLGATNFRGALGVRTLDVDSSQTPFKELNEWLNSGQPDPGHIQFVLQDLVFPFFNFLLLPIPLHATLGIRRNIEFGDNIEEAFSFAASPIKIAIGGFLILVEEFLVETFEPQAIEDSQVARVKITITRGSLPKITKLAASITDVATTVTVEDTSIFEGIERPFDAVIDKITVSNRETVKVADINGNELTLEARGTGRRAHAAGTVFEVDQFAENAVTIGFTDEWTAQAGWRRNKGWYLFTLGGAVNLMGLKIGFSFKRLYEKNNGLADYSCEDFWQLLADLTIEIKPSDNKYFRFEVLSNTFNAGYGATFLTHSIDPDQTDLSIDDPSVFQNINLPARFVIDADNSSKEFVSVISRTDNQLEVIRGLGVFAEVPHTRGSKIEVALDRESALIIWKDVGWNLGSLVFGGVTLPEGIQIVLFNFIKVIIQEIAVLTEKNGGTYFSFTGGIALDGKYSASLLVIRFRKKIAGNENAANWLLDGISFSLKMGTFELAGIGMAGEFMLDGHNYEEMQFGLEMKFRAMAQTFSLGVFFYKGQVSGPVDNFKYWMFGFKLGYLPLSGFDLNNLRAFAAGNMAPNLEPPDSSEQNLRLFKWYKNASSPLEISTDRKMNAWIPLKDSFSFGVGAAAGIGGTKTLLLDLFVFGHNGPSENILMIALELFLLKSQKAIGFGVLEVDLERDKWALFLGVSLSFSNVLPPGAEVPGLNNVAALSGNLYVGNKPGTFALGLLTDQNTWLGFRMKEERFFKMEIVVALCLQIVDKPEGPKGCGGLISAKGGVSFGVGKAEFYLNILLIAGIWKNESSTSGFTALFEACVRIKVFRIFNFGASVKIQFDYLGAVPEYRRLAFEIQIGTPWYLPDVTIRFEKVSREPEPEQQPLISTAIINAEALKEGVKHAIPLLLIAPQGGQVSDKRLCDMNELRSLDPGGASQQQLEEMQAIGVDSTIIFNFKPAVDDKLTIGEETPAGAGTQAATPPANSELSVTYELISLSIRRQPRYGPNAGEWTSLLAPENTEMPDLEDMPEGDELEALFSSAVRVLWDKDVQSQGRFDPRRLLINAETPFTLVTSNPEGDESLLQGQPGWPCCPGGRKEQWHQIRYNSMPTGNRVSLNQFFTDSRSTLHWLLQPRPLVTTSLHTPAHSPCARFHLNSQTEFSFAVIHFDQPAFHFRAEAYWQSQHRRDSVVLEGFRGILRIFRQSFELSNSQTTLMEMQAAGGFTRALFRFIARDGLSPILSSDAIEIVRMEYRTVAEQRDAVAQPLRCRNGEQSALSGAGKLAWLPNHNYEITATTRVVLQHNQTGAQEAEMLQRAYFRTKGMTGLNWVEHTGEEVEPFVESVYAKQGAPIIYRNEPIALAFTEQFNILLPVDRDPQPGDPAELNQILEWDLTVDKESDGLGHNRVSKSSPDWIIENRGTGGINPFDFTVPVRDVLLILERRASTIGLMGLRLQQILGSPFSCGNSISQLPPPSQVLLHKPVQPTPALIIPLWEANTAFRANLKEKGGPCVHRGPFERGDETSFQPFTEEGFADGSWQFGAGSIVLFEQADLRLTYYAVFGENSWDHVQACIHIDPEGAMAGFAIGVDTSAFGITRALIATIDEPERMLNIHRWSAGQLQLLKQTAIPKNLVAPYQLELVGYDDRFDVRLDDARLTVERADIRAGKLALVGRGHGKFLRLVVESLDAYRFYFHSSRFESFEDHINSAAGRTLVIPAGFAGQDEAQLIRDLYTATSAEIGRLMEAGTDQALRLNLFTRWAETIALPLIQQPNVLCISRLENPAGTMLLLLESPEPLRFTSELELRISKRMSHPLPPVLPPSGLGMLERQIPTELKTLEARVARRFPELRSFRIEGSSVTFTIPKAKIRSLPETPRFALTTASHEGKLKFFLFEISFTPVNRLSTRVEGTIKYGSDFSIFFQQFLIRAIRAQAAAIVPNQLLLLNSQGILISDIKLPDMSIPFFAPVHYRLLANGNENRLLIIPLTSTSGNPGIWTAGVYRFRFNLTRQRYRQETVDENSSYNRMVEMDFDW